MSYPCLVGSLETGARCSTPPAIFPPYFPMVQMDATFRSYFPTLGCWLAADYHELSCVFGSEDDVVHRYVFLFRGYVMHLWCSTISEVQRPQNYFKWNDGTGNHPKVGEHFRLRILRHLPSPKGNMLCYNMLYIIIYTHIYILYVSYMYVICYI